MEMDKNYRKRLFNNYAKTHVEFLDFSDMDKQAWFKSYFRSNYERYFREKPTDAKILEIGCNKGYLLKELFDRNYNELYGIDLSPLDIEKAKQVVPEAKLECADAFEYLGEHKECFDLILMKAVLEHVPKDQVLPMLQKVKDALRLDGLVIVDVPNMDWLFASHERYMDFTHEVGFTKESLRQIMKSLFLSVYVTEVDNIFDSSILTALKRKTGRFILKKLLTWADPEGGGNSIWARSIIAIGKK
jgi:2-polyprenyl-3-methyl-5-hydroxy-6-metoxy-1,4-benzoquinol methylase